MTKRLVNLCEVISVFSILFMVLGMFGRWHFTLDLVSHFRIQAAVALAVLSPVFYWQDRPRWAIASGIVGLLVIVSLWPFWMPSATAVDGKYRLMTVNVLTSNKRHDLVIDCIVANDPDFIILQETDSRWIEELDAALSKKWPHQMARSRADNFGIVFYSKMPWTTCEIVDYGGDYSTPAIHAGFRLPDGPVLRIIAIHPLPPMNQESWNSRNATFSAVAEDVRDSSAGRTLVVGDLNCTPWSYWFRRLMRESGLRNSAERRGLNITWTPFVLSIAGLPLDHVLVGPGIEVSKRSVGPNIGSDHRPVIVDFN